MERIRQAIERQVLGVTGMALKEIDFEHPRGDPGWFGPQSAIWQVHGDFTSMLCGGVSALLLQMLHPLALAGVWDHSNFRADMLGRLRRTSQFISATTFGPTADAERLVVRVRAIHLKITGTSADGTPYAASAPELLTWVHVAECRSFMAAYRRYKRRDIPISEQDRYYQEAARIAIALGAREVPTTAAQIDDYLRQMRGQLRCDARTLEVARLVMAAPVPTPLALPVRHIVMQAAVDLLPDWAAEQLMLSPGPIRRHAARTGIHLLARVLRASVRNGAYHRAQRRMADGVNPDYQRL